MIPPTRIADGNGMEIIGWAKNSRLLLVRTEECTSGSDAPDTQRVLAIDAGTGMVYEPDLEAMLQQHKDKQCFFRLADAGFAASGKCRQLGIPFTQLAPTGCVAGFECLTMAS